MPAAPHVPVMLNECVEGLNVRPGGVYFDGTVGYGGHSEEILNRCTPGGRLIATDLDDEAVEFSRNRLKKYEGSFSIYRSNFKDYAKVLESEGVEALDGAILDFGLSSLQIDKEERGFSYLSEDAPLDMRMDTRQDLTAAKVLNEFPERDIEKILREYGEETFAKQIAARVVRFREKKPLETCGEFSDIIESSIPYKFRQNGPCQRKSFQAVRIAVNGELDGLYDCIVGLTRKLKSGGRIAIITFQSLEDRIVKDAFRMLETDCVCDKSLPVCVCGKIKEIEIITKKPITAGAEEIKANSRSKSAKLRIAQKI
ncbi:MAG: 16S rRNA (cytosine(1402)-N(4))-methyltransferase RsmH [Clostridia bacterium]|nr:16S rRNA (cytosine(1402)-N(4))-methyltransferase RsmH [Clostridia bacterium]